jgi:hypothetical protein
LSEEHRGGGGQKKSAHKYFVGKYLFSAENMYTAFLVKHGRWVYEGGEVKENLRLKSLKIGLIKLN